MKRILNVLRETLNQWVGNTYGWDTDGIGVYRKDAFSGHYTNIDSFVSWRHKISWVKALVDLIHRTSSPSKIKYKLKQLEKIIVSSWNSFPNRIAYSLIHWFVEHQKQNTMNVLLKLPKKWETGWEKKGRIAILATRIAIWGISKQPSTTMNVICKLPKKWETGRRG